MQPTLQLVADRGALLNRRTRSQHMRAHPSAYRPPAGRGRTPRLARGLRELASDERGAVTAEYAIVIMAAVAFAGLLVAIMRSSEIRALLVQLVENALGAAN